MQRAEPCTQLLCTQFRQQHGNITQRCTELEKELENARKQHAALFTQVVTRGEASMIREERTGESGMRLPSGELMTPERFMTKTKMMNQCVGSLQTSEKRARQLTEENTRLKQERDSIYTSMRKFEDTLNGFEKARHFTFTDAMHRTTLNENARLVEQVEKLLRSEAGLQEDNAVLRRGILADEPSKRARRCVESDGED